MMRSPETTGGEPIRTRPPTFYSRSTSPLGDVAPPAGPTSQLGGITAPIRACASLPKTPIVKQPRYSAKYATPPSNSGWYRSPGTFLYKPAPLRSE